MKIFSINNKYKHKNYKFNSLKKNLTNSNNKKIMLKKIWKILKETLRFNAKN